MFTNGNISKGLKGINPNPVKERQYLYRYGKNLPEASGGWSASGYELYNGKTIQEGGNLRVANSLMTITSPGNNSNKCVLLGTGIAVATLSKRYLVVEAVTSDNTAASNFQIILSKSKELNDDSSTVFYSFAFQETSLKYYIDLSELSGFTRAYIAIAGGATANWSAASVNLQVKSVYLTDYRNDSIIPLYNRGKDYSTRSEGDDADKLIGWEGYTAGTTYVAGTLESNDMLLESTADKGSAVTMTRAADISKMSALKILYDVIELPASNSTTLTAIIKDEDGGNLYDSETTITSLGRGTKSMSYSLLKSYLRNKNKVAIIAGAGAKIKVYAVWEET